MTFNSAKEMLEYIQEGNDLYNQNIETYVFVYSDAGSIAYYSIDNDHAKELSQTAKEYNEYWGAFLGCGGYIVDDPDSDSYREGRETNLEWCEGCYMEEGWVNTNDYPQE